MLASADLVQHCSSVNLMLFVFSLACLAPTCAVPLLFGYRARSQLTLSTRHAIISTLKLLSFQPMGSWLSLSILSFLKLLESDDILCSQTLLVSAGRLESIKVLARARPRLG